MNFKCLILSVLLCIGASAFSQKRVEREVVHKDKEYIQTKKERRFSTSADGVLDSTKMVINYLDSKRKIIKNTRKAKYYEFLKKENDSLWFSEIFLKNINKRIHSSYFKTKERKVVVGETKHYNLKGDVVALRYYNSNGDKLGVSTRWFDNGQVNLIGRYENGKQEGSWNFYHINGTLAAEKKYHKGALDKVDYYNEKGELLPRGSFINKKEAAVFKGGKEKYNKKIQSLYLKLKQFRKERGISFNFRPKVKVRYTVNVNGRITDVSIDEAIPIAMNDFIVNWFEHLKGWSPRVHMNRKVPKNMSHWLYLRKK